jgi:hypothetical protein
MKNYLQFNQLDSACIKKADLNESDIEPALRVLYMNNALQRVYRLLDGLNDPWYTRTSLAVSVSGDVEILTDAQITSYASTDNLIDRASGSWNLGDVLAISIFSGAGAHVADFVGIVNLIDPNDSSKATLTVLGTDADLSANKITVIRYKSPTGSIIDLSSLYVKSITRVYDNAYTGGKVRVFRPIMDPLIWSQLHRDPVFYGEVCYRHIGDKVELNVGKNAASLATVNFDYRGKPALCSDVDSANIVDIPPEENDTLMNEVTSLYLQHQGKEAPPDVASRAAEFGKRYDAAVNDAAKAATVKGKRGE